MEFALLSFGFPLVQYFIPKPLFLPPFGMVMYIYPVHCMLEVWKRMCFWFTGGYKRLWTLKL